jgi:hypothetical protein
MFYAATKHTIMAEVLPLSFYTLKSTHWSVITADVFYNIKHFSFSCKKGFTIYEPMIGG